MTEFSFLVNYPLMYTFLFLFCIKSEPKQHTKAEQTVIGRFACPSAGLFLSKWVYLCLSPLFR